jgi:hypothetical protein
VEAPDERSAIAEAANQFTITPAWRFKLVMTRTRVEERERGE